MSELSEWQLGALKRAVPQWNLPGYFGCAERALKDLVSRGLMETKPMTGVLENGREWSSTFYRVTQSGIDTYVALRPQSAAAWARQAG